jgi:hypothetical protein
VISLVGQDRRGQVGWPARLPLATGNSSNAASPRRREHTIEELVILQSMSESYTDRAKGSEQADLAPLGTLNQNCLAPRSRQLVVAVKSLREVFRLTSLLVSSR